MRIPYPIKDYRDAVLYPRSDDASVGWRWEFLRRHPDYQGFHAEHADRALTREDRAELRDRFGATRLDDPRDDANAMSAATTSGGLVTSAEAAKLVEQLLVTIDPTIPLEPQFDRIRQATERGGRRPSVKTLRRQEWPGYLRVLDADAAGATRDEMVTAIFRVEVTEANRKRVTRAKREAQRLLDTFAIGRPDPPDANTSK